MREIYTYIRKEERLKIDELSVTLKVSKEDQTIDSKKAEGTVNSKKVIKIKTALSERESKKQ